jgi:hypothetical protein
MRDPINDQIARSAIDPQGPTHVGVWLALALHQVCKQPIGPVTGNHNVAKCAGAELACCSVCVRSLAALCADQQWVEPTIKDGSCTLFADVAKYGHLCQLAEPKQGAQ